MNSKTNLFVNGGLWSVFNIFTSFYLTLFALALGASNTVIGFIGAIPYLAAILGEIPGAKLVEYFPRKSVFVILSLLERLSWTGVIAVPLLFKEAPLIGVVVFYLFARICSSMYEPAWISSMADIIPSSIRGSFFGERNRVIEFVSIISTFLAGLYLNYFDNSFGFQSMMLVGMVFGILSTIVASKLRIPGKVSHHHHRIREFFIAEGSWRKFLIFCFFFYFAVMFASPFFTVYMYNYLGMSYTYYGIASAISSLARVMAYKPLGRLSDKFGDKKLAFLSVLGTAFVPLFFIFITPSTLFLVIPAQILSGIVWAGADLLLFNLLLDFSRNSNRTLRTAEYTMAISLSSIVAPIVGGFFADSISFMNGIQFVFAIAVVLRILSSLLLLRLPERRSKRKALISDIFHEIAAIDPIKGAQHSIRRVVKAGRTRLKLWLS